MLSAKYLLPLLLCLSVALFTKGQGQGQGNNGNNGQNNGNNGEDNGNKAKEGSFDPGNGRACFKHENGTVQCQSNVTFIPGNNDDNKWSGDFTGDDGLGGLYRLDEDTIPVNFSSNTECPRYTKSDQADCCPTCHYLGHIPRYFTSDTNIYQGQRCYVDYRRYYFFSSWLIHGICEEPNKQCGDNKGVVPFPNGDKYRYQCKQLYATQPNSCTYCKIELCYRYRFWVGYEYYRCYRCYGSQGVYKYPFKCACKPVKLDAVAANNGNADNGNNGNNKG